MNEKVLNILEFNKITEKLASFAASTMGKEAAREIRPIADINEIRLRQEETSSAVSMATRKGRLSLGGLVDVRPYLQRVAVGGTLSIRELLHIGDFLYVSRRAKNYAKSENKNENFGMLQGIFDEIGLVQELENEINRCIVSEYELADDASDTLKDIRRDIRLSNSKIKEHLNSIIHSGTYKTMLQEPVVTTRSDRYCVPIKSEYRNSFPGMVHDQSSTGATVFMEPMSVVQLNNKIKGLVSQEKSEIEKILMRLSENVNGYLYIFQTNIELLTRLDFIFAKAELSISMNGTEPDFNTNGRINIKKGRHPLLDKESVVPTDIYLGKDFTTLLITGPNTGGKTVSLKTIGLFTLMGQAGLHIPAFDHSELSVFDRVFADIGDEQSIEQSLSTFSSHMTNIVNILKEVTDTSLVLLDELGAGTDPTEGAALAIAIIEDLHKRGIRTAVTTHYSELKLYALGTDGVENAACEFDVDSLRPTYKLLIGIPGKSNAFAISRRLGLPEYIINDARNILKNDDVKIEDVITNLEISQKTAVMEKERAEQYRRETEKIKKELEEQKQKLKKEREKLISEAKEEARRTLSDAKDEADKIIKQMQKLSKENAGRKEMDDLRQGIKDKLSKVEGDIAGMSNAARILRKTPKKLSKGDRVYVHSFGQTGTVISDADNSGEALVKLGIMRVRVHLSDLSLDETKETVKKAESNPAMSARAGKARNISPDIDLRGLMVEEAIGKTDKYLDDAHLAGIASVTIIHGKGTGALRSAIQNHLKNHPHVKDYRLGQFGEGETGVTIVQLK